MLPSYRNQSIDLHSQTFDWFLYVGNTGNYWVNVQFQPISSTVTLLLKTFEVCWYLFQIFFKNT